MIPFIHFKFILNSLLIISLIFISSQNLYSTVIVGLHTREGIVLAADSRVTYTKNNKKLYEDTAEKLIVIGDCALAIFGTVGIGNDNLSELVKDLDINDKTKFPYIESLGQYYAIWNKCCNLFENKYYKWFDKVKNPKGGFFIAGLEQGVLMIRTNYFDPSTRRSRLSILPAGIIFKGQTNVISRLLYGVDEQLCLIDDNLAFDRDLIEDNLGKKKDIYEILKKFQYLINYDEMSLEEGIQFAKFLVNATIIMNKYSHGTKLNPRSDISEVGGDIDILVITNKGLKWVEKKQ